MSQISAEEARRRLFGKSMEEAKRKQTLTYKEAKAKLELSDEEKAERVAKIVEKIDPKAALTPAQILALTDDEKREYMEKVLQRIDERNGQKGE